MKEIKKDQVYNLIALGWLPGDTLGITSLIRELPTYQIEWLRKVTALVYQINHLAD